MLDSILYRKKRAGILAVAAALVLGGCGHGGPDAEMPPQVRSVTVNPLQQVQTVKIGLGDVKKREIYEGIISPYVEELCFPEDGIFLEYRVSLGDTVRRGDTLAVTDVSAYREQAENLQEQIDELTAKYIYE